MSKDRTVPSRMQQEPPIGLEKHGLMGEPRSSLYIERKISSHGLIRSPFCSVGEPLSVQIVERARTSSFKGEWTQLPSLCLSLIQNGPKGKCLLCFCSVISFSPRMILLIPPAGGYQLRITDGDGPAGKPERRPGAGFLPGDLPEGWPELRLPRGPIHHRLLLPLYLPHLAVYQRPRHPPENLVFLPAAVAVSWAVALGALPRLHG